jgi:putative sigma-54 modulation protein
MNINLTFKNFEPSEHLKQYARKRFEKIVKYMSNKSDNSEVLVNLTVEKFRHKAEVTFVGDYAHISAFEESEDMYSTIDLVLDKLEAQVRKLREKNKDKRRGLDKTVSMEFITYSETDGKRERTITARDHYEPKPMSVDEAAEQLENLHYEFLVFRNSENERVNVIYRRKNNDFGLIDPGT